MRIGVRAHDYGRHTPEVLAANIRQAGFESVQLAISKGITGMEQDIGRLTPGLAFEIGQAFRDQKINIAVLGCYIEPVHPDEEIRRLHIRRFKEHILYARDMGALVVGTETTLFRAEEPLREKAFQTLLRTVDELVNEAERFGVVVGIEPVAAHTLNSPELTARMLETIGSNNLQIIFDPVNLITPDIAVNHDDMLDRAFDAFGHRIMALHCKDIILNNGKIEETLLGKGIVNYEKLMGWLKENRPSLSLLREGANPETAQIDIDFLRSII